MSENGISNFFNTIQLKEIDVKTWASIEKRLMLPVQNKVNRNKRKQKVTRFSYKDNNEFNGIIQYLTSVSNGNVVKNKTIEIKCGNFCCGSIEKLVNFNCKQNYVHVTSSPNRWIEFDFKDRQIQINSYIMKSGNRDNNVYLIHWKVEISNDEQEWEKVDEPNDVNELNGKNLIKAFNIKLTKPFRFIRFFTDKKGKDGANQFEIGQIEFFGQIVE